MTRKLGILRYSVLIFALAIVLGCENSQKESKGEGVNVTLPSNSVVGDSNVNSNVIPPSDVFVDFMLEIEAQNWGADTARVRKVGLYSLDDVKIQSFQNRPFYNLKYDQTLTSIMLGYFPSDEVTKASRAFSQANQIWGYFYRDKEGEGMISDGVIEQWIYPNESKAKIALEYFDKYGSDIFFNTMPFFHQNGESIYVFHARAMGFSYDQKPLFEKFLKKLNSMES